MVLQRRVDISLRRCVSLLTRTALAAAVAGIFFPVLSFAAQPESAFLLRRGAIVDPARGAAYVSKPNGTIDAVDLASGRTLWTSDEAAVPLGADEELLIAQLEEKPRATERLQVVVLDAANGGKVSEVSIALPAGVRGLVSDERGRSLRVTAEREGALFLVSWYYLENRGRGIAPERAQQMVRRFAGSARVHPRTGKVVASDGGLVEEVPGKWKKYGTPPGPPWTTGNVSAQAEGGRGGPLKLKRTNTGNGQPLPERTLSKQAITAVASADQRHLLASERVGEGGPDDPEYSWNIFALDTAEKATDLRRDVSAAPFFVFSDSVIFESVAHAYRRGDVQVDEPLEIQAIRLSTGVAKWEVELRDLGYRGPTPPAR
jgi:hypothetical protein